MSLRLPSILLALIINFLFFPPTLCLTALEFSVIDLPKGSWEEEKNRVRMVSKRWRKIPFVIFGLLRSFHTFRLWSRYFNFGRVTYSRTMLLCQPYNLSFVKIKTHMIDRELLKFTHCSELVTLLLTALEWVNISDPFLISTLLWFCCCGGVIFVCFFYIGQFFATNSFITGTNPSDRELKIYIATESKHRRNILDHTKIDLTVEVQNAIKDSV